MRRLPSQALNLVGIRDCYINGDRLIERLADHGFFFRRKSFFFPCQLNFQLLVCSNQFIKVLYLNGQGLNFRV